MSNILLTRLHLRMVPIDSRMMPPRRGRMNVKREATVMLDRGWIVVLRVLGVDPRRVLQQARLSAELLGVESTRVPVSDYFALVNAIEAEAGDPTLALRMASVSSPELFSPPFFAALCCSNLTTAVKRLAVHKRLVAPMQIVWRETEQGLEVSWRWDDTSLRPPPLVGAFELAFLVQLARIGTRERLVPVRVACPHPLSPASAFESFFGVVPVLGGGPEVIFSATDSLRPFVTASESLWRSFQPELQRLRSEAEAVGSLTDRVRAAIQECLPSGEASIDAAARRLRIGRRTLQRRLSIDGITFRDLVREVRERLAIHYVSSTKLPYSEVSFLLGFEEPSSFFRAFREWTNATPEELRSVSTKANKNPNRGTKETP